MKNLIKSILILSIFTFVATSCSDDDEPTFAKPVISNLEVGGHHHEDEKEEDHDHDHEENIGHIGEDLHIEADIVAEGKIAYIMVEIHNKKTGVDIVEKQYKGDDIVGSKNTKFHEHVDIPAKINGKDVAEGDYHFHLKVVDQQDQETEVSRDIKLEIEKE